MLSIRNLSKEYKPKKGQKVIALNNVSLDIADKGLVFLLGKSGSGKSTLLNLLGGLDTYTSGDIIIKGKSTKDFKQSNFDSYRNTFIGFIFQEFNILEEYSVGQNISMALELQHKPGDRASVEDLLSKVDLDGYYDRKPNELSGGQKQRVAIARALIKKPEIIMADEPTGALDSKTGKQVFDTLKAISKEKLVLVVTHDRENAEIYGDRIIELADGNIISDRLRSNETGDLVEQNVTLIDSKLIKIKAGTALTSEDIATISNAISSSREDVYISLDSSANDNFSQIAEQKTGQNSSTFVPTGANDIVVKDYDEKQFALVKSRLPFKDSFRMGVSGLKFKKVRLIFTILLSFLAFTMAGFSSAVSLFDRDATETETLALIKSKNVMIRSLKGEDYGMGMQFSEYGAEGLTPDQINKLQLLSGNNYIKLMQSPNNNQQSLDFSNNLKDYPIDMKQRMIYWQTNFQNFAYVNNAESVGLTKASDNSRLPTESDEIAISDYVAESFIKYGHVFDGIESTIGSAGDLIGKSIGTKNMAYKITGVYNTGIDMSGFMKFKNVQVIDQMSAMLFDSTKLFTGMAYVAPDFSLDSEQGGDSVYFRNGSAQIFGGDTAENIYMNSAYRYNQTNDIESDMLHVDSDIATKMQGDAVILSSYMAQRLLLANQGSLTFEQIKAEWDNLPAEKKTINVKYAANNTPDTSVPVATNIVVAGISNDGNSTWKTSNSLIKKILKVDKSSGVDASWVNFDKYAIGADGHSNFYTSRVSQYVDYAVIPPESKANIYWGSGLSAKSELADNEIIVSAQIFMDSYGGGIPIDPEDAKRKFDAMDKKALLGTTQWTDNTESVAGWSTKFNIVGVDISMSNFNNAIVNSKNIANLKELKSAPTKIVLTLKDDKASRDVFSYLKNSEVKQGRSANKLAVDTHVSSLFDMVTSILSVVKTVFIWISVVFSIFAALLFMNFIGTSIAYKKKDIGVLRAIGARSTDVFKIFFNESLVIGLINLALSCVALGVISVVINNLVGIVIMSFNILPYLLMAGISALVVFISTFLPVRKIANKKPIDAINNR